MDFNNTGAISTTNEWLTCPKLVQALGPFDLDPCSPPPERRPWDTATKHYDGVNQDGLKADWQGRVWLNPPYGTETFKWMDKLKEHGSGIGLIFARTETRGFHASIWENAHALMFFKGRLAFNGIISQYELDHLNRQVTLVALGEIDKIDTTALATQKRTKKKTLNKINDSYYWFKGDSSNAPSCLVSYSENDTNTIRSVIERGDIKGRLVIL